jgi:hypothetical protein
MSYTLVRRYLEVGRVPTIDDMLENELVVNVTDKIAFVKVNDAIVTLPFGASSGGSGTVTSVATSVTGAGLTVTGGPISTSGTLVFELSTNLKDWSGVSPSTKLDATHEGTGGTAHLLATGSVPGFLSSSDFTKLAGIATSANNYSHPTGFSNQPTVALSNAAVVSQITINTNGHVTAVVTRNLTAANIGAAASSHVLDSASHTISGKTSGQMLLATAATTFAFVTATGDISITGGGVTLIANAAVTTAKLADTSVTNAKLSNVATATIKGRVTAATGVPEDLTATQVRTLINVANGATSNVGTVTSVGITFPSIFSVTPATITTSGTFAVTFATQTSALVFASPVSGTGVPTFRSLAIGDLPVAASGVSNATSVVRADDSRLSDSRIPTGHVLDSSSHTISGKTSGQMLLATAATTFDFVTATGDISITGAGVTLIASGAVNNNKMSDVGTETLKGRINSGTGKIQDLTTTEVRTLINVANGATANASDASLRDRTTHTGVQAQSTITMDTNRLLGRTTASSGATELITVGTGLVLSAGVLSTGATVPLTTYGAAHTFIIADVGTGTQKTTTSALTFTIPANSTTSFPNGSIITVLNNASSGNLTIAGAGGVTIRLTGTSTTGSRVIAPYGAATCWRASSDLWFVSGAGVS